jgi:hypothetical protein
MYQLSISGGCMGWEDEGRDGKRDGLVVGGSEAK